MSIWIVLVAAVASWVFGAAFYMALAKRWLDAVDFPPQTRAALEGGKRDPAPFILSFLAELVMAFMLALLLRGTGAVGILGGITVALTCWLGFVLTTIATNNAYGMRKYALTAIDSAHWLGVLLIQGAVLGAFLG